MALSVSNIIDLINNNFPDNITQDIDPADLRDTLIQLVNSVYTKIDDREIIGMSEFDSTKNYVLNECVAFNNDIYQCIVSVSTTGSFLPIQWKQISTYISSTSGLSIYAEKQNVIELDNNKLIKTIATDTSLSAIQSGIYMIQASTIPTGLNEEYPTLGKSMLYALRRTASAESLYICYPTQDFSKYFIKRGNSDWFEFTSGSVNTTYSNGLTKFGDDVQATGAYSVIELSGSDYTINSTGIIFLNGNTKIDGDVYHTGNYRLGDTPSSITGNGTQTIITGALKVDSLTGKIPDDNTFIVAHDAVTGEVYKVNPMYLNGTAGTSGGGITDISYYRTDPTKLTVGGLVAGSIPNFDTMQDLFDSILYPFTVPTISLASSSLHEKGLTINKSMIYGITLNDATLADRTIYLNGSNGYTLPSNSGTYNSTTGLTFANAPNPSVLYYAHTFNLKVNFTNSGQLNSNILVEFASPTYYGVLDISDVNETNVKALTKRIRKKANDATLNFNPTLQRYVYAYPTVYGDLVSIIDQNGFNVTSGFTKTTATYTLADSTTEGYNIYTSNSNTTQTNFKLSFNF